MHKTEKPNAKVKTLKELSARKIKKAQRKGGRERGAAKGRKNQVTTGKLGVSCT